MASWQQLARLDSEDVEKAVRGALIVYSALRDPTDNMVRVLVDAQSWLYGKLGCHFALKGSVNPVYGHGDKEVESAHNYSSFVDQSRLYDGFLLECADPGPEYEQLVLRLHDLYEWELLVAVVQITRIETSLASDLGLCFSSLYTQDPELPVWVHDAVSAGVGLIHIYYVNSKVNPAMHSLQRLLGVTSHKKDWQPFAPLPLSNVRYYGYAPPLFTHLFSQRTMLNDCLYRTRHMHNLVFVIDTDEYISNRFSATKPVAVVMREYLTSDSASLRFHRLYYPHCQIAGRYAGHMPNNISINDEAFMVSAGYGIWTDPKFAYVPLRVHSLHQHGVHTTEPGFRNWNHMSPDVLFIKHVRKGWACPANEVDDTDLIDDRDSDVFQNFIDSQLQKEGQEQMRWVH